MASSERMSSKSLWSLEYNLEHSSSFIGVLHDFLHREINLLYHASKQIRQLSHKNKFLTFKNFWHYFKFISLNLILSPIFVFCCCWAWCLKNFHHFNFFKVNFMWFCRFRILNWEAGKVRWVLKSRQEALMAATHWSKLSFVRSS